jgi:hypothetical protein
MSSKYEALCKLYAAINHPAKASKSSVTYSRENVDAMLVVLNQLIELEKEQE